MRPPKRLQDLIMEILNFGWAGISSKCIAWLGFAWHRIMLYGVKPKIDGKLQPKESSWIQYANHYPHPQTVL